MAKYIFMLGCVLVVLHLNAQQTIAPVQLTHYVFDSFHKGKVKVKTGVTTEQTLNYNIITNEMIFDNGGKMMAIGNAADVDTVFIQDRKFIPIGDKFYEVLTNTKLPLLLEFTATIDEPGASVGYGNASGTTNATSLRTLVKSGDVYGLKLPDDFKITPGFIFRILKDGELLKAGSAKQLAAIFPEKKKLITELAKKNNTNFKTGAEVAVLVQQIQE